MTREKDRLKFREKIDLMRAFGLIKGLLGGIKDSEDCNKTGLISVLEEVQSILEKQIGVRND